VTGKTRKRAKNAAGHRYKEKRQAQKADLTERIENDLKRLRWEVLSDQELVGWNLVEDSYPFPNPVTLITQGEKGILRKYDRK